jgi:hypothetical protein
MDDVPSQVWIFQAVRERYDLEKHLAPGRAEAWSVSSSAGEVTPGDVAYLWQAGQEDALWGWARVATSSVDASLAETPKSPAATPASIELVYEARFEKPVRRREILADERLVGLPVLESTGATNFLLTAEQVVAFAELLRRKGLEAPPQAAPEPDLISTIPNPGVKATSDISPSETRMPGEPTSSWDDLSPAAKDVIAWAEASEQASGRVGTRGVLIGLLRTSSPTEATQLLAYCGTQPEQVFEALQEVRPGVAINPTINNPSSLTELPSLTPNADKLLKAASALRSGSAVEPRHLFGAMLEIQESRAREALAQALEGRIEIETVQATYNEYLDGPSTQTYLDFLRGRFAGARPSTAITSDSWTDRDQLEHELYADAIARFI